jgi:predicted PurR-regulated permease PerM
MTKNIFNARITQVIVLIIIILIAILLIKQLFVFLPGVLGALTLYIVSRATYFNLIFKHKWKKGIAAFVFILGYLSIISLLVFVSVSLISPKVNEIIKNQDKLISTLETAAKTITEKTGTEILSSENIKNAAQKVSSFVPSLLTGTATTLANIFIMFFMLYFLLVNGRDLEKRLNKLIPLKPHNINILATETKMMIKANALGIPIICLVQGVVAALGYLIFGMDDWAMWGFLTGVFAFFPLVGTMIIWVPLTVFLYAQGHTGGAIGLGLYSLLVTGNIDYIARISVMKKMGDVHPLITVLGVIVGLNIFGFVGLVFGPLLISYFLILVKIYVNEFSNDEEEDLDNEKNE